jgi:hypothetical protein
MSSLIFYKLNLKKCLFRIAEMVKFKLVSSDRRVIDLESLSILKNLYVFRSFTMTDFEKRLLNICLNFKHVYRI